MSLRHRRTCLAAALAGMVPVLLLLAAGGEHADSDALAHLVWARQVIRHGSPRIAEDGVFDDVSQYYPNTVPKPLPLLVSLPAAAAGGAGLLQALYLVFAFLGLLAAASLALREGGGTRAAWWASLALGMNPAWVMLTIRCRPAVILIAAVLALPALTRFSVLEPLAALTRPEGIFLSAWRALRGRRGAGLAVLLAAVAAWPLLNLWAAGDPLWSLREVRLAVEQMDYPTPGPAAYPLLLLRRLFLVAGPVMVLALFSKIRRWPLAVPLAAWAAVLWVSLSGGSLVLPRYLDPLVLLAVPWAVVMLVRMMPKGEVRVSRAVLALAVAASLTLWPSALADWQREHGIQMALERLGRDGWCGRLAVNELLVPRVAEAAGTTDLSRGFVALDRAAWEGVDLDSLGVGTVAVVDHPVYLPAHTLAYLESRGICPDTLWTEE
ncbi:MAG: hypothetical protein ACQETZ_03105 [Candidatus Fermentibacterota bacterium]